MTDYVKKLKKAESEFNREGALSPSSANQIAGRTVAHKLYKQTLPMETSPQMALGLMVHCLALEPDTFEDKFVIVDKFARRSNADKERWAELEVEADGRPIVWTEDAEPVFHIVEQLMAHPIAGEWLSDKELLAEMKIGWQDPVTRCHHKGIVDGAILPSRLALDIKTMPDCSLDAVQKEIGKHGYHRQLAMYVDGINTILGEDVIDMAALVCVETTGDHQVAVYEMDPAALELGRMSYRKIARMWMNYLESPEGWHGYPIAIQTVGVPRWAQ